MNICINIDAWTMDMLHRRGHVAWIWTCCMGMDVVHGHGHGLELSRKLLHGLLYSTLYNICTTGLNRVDNCSMDLVQYTVQHLYHGLELSRQLLHGLGTVHCVQHLYQGLESSRQLLHGLGTVHCTTSVPRA
jgi:hypothetical protein